MEKIIISGGKRLFGNVKLQGSKNAALPIIFASILTNGVSKLYNLPKIGDVYTALEIVKDMGAHVNDLGEYTEIDTRDVRYKTPSELHTSKIRASTYLIGACLARFGKAEITRFGGCNFGNRPIDIHLDVAKRLGAEFRDGELIAKGLFGAEITMPKPSVGATINALIMASVAEGVTELRGFAREPHVMALIDYLLSAGADIEDQGDRLLIRGSELHGGVTTVIPDMIEAGTYLLLSPLLSGRVTVSADVVPSLASYIGTLAVSGVKVHSSCGQLWLEETPVMPIDVITEPYPGYPTDLQPQLCPLMALGVGGRIEEQVWRDRFTYLGSLSEFGIKSSREGNVADIYSSDIKPAHASATDLRGGAACLLAALTAKGTSEIYAPEVILRGYSSLKENLSALGADIRIV